MQGAVAWFKAPVVFSKEAFAVVMRITLVAKAVARALPKVASLAIKSYKIFLHRRLNKEITIYI